VSRLGWDRLPGGCVIVTSWENGWATARLKIKVIVKKLCEPLLILELNRFSLILELHAGLAPSSA
jgi:hypothetical protein